MLKREAGFRHVVGMTDIDHRITVWLGVGIGLVHDRKDCRSVRRGPTAEDPGALERVASERSEADHVSTCAFI
jgi:hypothetical protein